MKEKKKSNETTITGFETRHIRYMKPPVFVRENAGEKENKNMTACTHVQGQPECERAFFEAV